MESASSAMNASQLHPSLSEHSPYDPYRDHFDASSSRHAPESWSSGRNDSPSPQGNGNMNDNIGGGMDSMQGLQGDENGPIGGRADKIKKRFICPHCTRTFARSGHLQ